ncbi:hypothetical protein BH09CHL1_BH09CHL1_23950 [soil metagenome]
MVATQFSPVVTQPLRVLNDAQSLLNRYGATDEGFQAIGELLRKFARHPEIAGLIDAHEPYASIFNSLVLAEHEFGPTLLLTRIPNGRETPERKNLSWGIACVVRGRDRLTTWRRGPLDGELNRVGEVDLNAGDFVYFHEPPRDLHSQQGIGGASWQLVLYGRNPLLKRSPRTTTTKTTHLELVH